MIGTMPDSPPPYLCLFVDRPPWYQVSESASLSDEEGQVHRLKVRMRVLEDLLEETKQHIRELEGEITEQAQALAGTSSSPLGRGCLQVSIHGDLTW